MLADLLQHTIDIYRAQAGPGVQTGYGTDPYNGGISCLIQPVTGEYTSKTDQNYGRQYNCIMQTGTDISISDRVIDQDGKTYQVTGSFNRNYGTMTPHITMILTEEAMEGPDV